MESIGIHDSNVLNSVKVLVVEDYCGVPELTESYRELCSAHGFEFRALPVWSNMHGAASAAFDIAEELWAPEWFIYLGDDIQVTPYALSSAVHFLEANKLYTIGLVQLPYWNSHDLTPQQNDVWTGLPILEDKMEMWTRDCEWLRYVPSNPHWDGFGIARPYINVNGAGFACHKMTYYQAGGFAEETWCLDESISYRVWTRTQRGICCLPGPPLVHYFGGSTETSPPAHDLHTEQAWIRATGLSKKDAAETMYRIMDERGPAIVRETSQASYFEVPK